MNLKEQYMLYDLAGQLLIQEKYELIHINVHENEVWLAKTKRNTTKIIRLIQRGFDWRNHLRLDIQSLFQRVKSLKHHFRGGKIEIFNVYISELEPIDDWEYLKKPIELKDNDQIVMNVFYLSNERKAVEQARFLENIDTQMEYETMYPPLEEQEKMVQLYKNRLRKHLQDRTSHMRKVFAYGKPRYTFILIYMNLIMFFILESSGGSTNLETLVQFGAKVNEAIVAGEWWRLLSSMFIHIGFIHLIMNMIALYFLGTTVERIFGSKRFLIIYFLAGIGGSLTSFAFNPIVAAGASGALFGLFGALLFFGSVYPKLFSRTLGKDLLFVLAINLIIGFIIPQIDMGAHLGGLIAGYLAAALVYVPNKKNIWIQLLAAISFSLFVLFLIFYGLMIYS